MCPAIVSDVSRAGPEFAATEYWTWPLPVPVVPLPILSQEAPPFAVQALRPLAMRALARQAVRISLTAGRDHDPAASRAYLDFAGRVHPPVRAGLAWRLAEHRLVSDRFALPGPPQLVTRVGHHLRWRRERRYGT